MKQFLFASVLVVFLFSCTKKEVTVSGTNPPVNQPSYTVSDYTQLTAGNYWVYGVYNVDSLGNATLLSVDSCYITTDSIKNGNTYAVMINPPFLGNNNYLLLRDSSTCLVDQHGTIYFAYGDFNTILRKDTIPGITSVIYSVPDSPVNDSVPIGTYSCYDFMGIVEPYANYPTRYTHSYFSLNIGMVELIEFYINSPNTTLQHRLLRAHIM